MANASKSIVAELNKDLKLNDDNYEVWSMKIQYVLEEQEALETLTAIMEEPEDGTTAQHRRDKEAYLVWKKKNSTARIILLSAMSDDIAKEFKGHDKAMNLWIALKEKFGGVSLTKLRSLTIKFDTYKKHPDHTIKRHLREMSNMISELNDAGHKLTEEQKIQAVIRSLPNNWEHMRMHLTHSVNVKTFQDAVRHLELEEDRLLSIKVNTEVHATSSKSAGNSSNKKRKCYKGKGKSAQRPKKQQAGQNLTRSKRKVNLARVKCYNCQQKGHYARDCTAPKKVQPIYSYVSELNVSSSVFLSESNPLWVVDSGATDHVTKDRDSFIEFRRVPYGARWIYVGNNARVEVKGIGTCRLVMRDGRTLLLHDVLYAPSIRRNLVSVIVLMKMGFQLFFSDNFVKLSMGTTYYGSGYILDDFIILDVEYVNSNNNAYSLITSSHENDVMIWHARLNHIGQDRMSRLAKEGLLGNIDKVELPNCEHCLKGKMARKPFGKATRADTPLQLIHSDICGPMNVRARHGAYYFITFIDDYTRYGQIYLISHKSEALSCFKTFMNLVENQLDKRIKALRTDRGREYLSDEFKALCDEKGIEHQLSIPRTPQQNGVAERRNRTLLDMVRSMMAQANLPISFWGDALQTAAYVLNRVPSKSVTSTPYELWTGRKPDLSLLRPWGCTAFVHDTSSKYGKLGPRGKKSIFVRYSDVSKGYVFVGEQDNGLTTEFESRDVTFIENEFPKLGNIGQEIIFYETQEEETSGSLHSSGRIFEKEETENVRSSSLTDANVPDPESSGRIDPYSSGSMDLDPSRTIPNYDEYQRYVYQDSEPRKSTRKKAVPQRFRESDSSQAFLLDLSDDEPKNVKEALSCPAKDKWIKAMEEEMASMSANQVWTLVDLPKGRKTIGNKWILKVKRKADGSIERYKARLVAKGYTQQEGIDYEETFSPVVRFTSIRLVLAIVTNLDLELHQMDVKTAFLNGELNEEIYMDQPVGFIEQGSEHKVCRLLKSIYGLKQSSRQWYIRFHNAIISYGFTMIYEDHCVYTKRSGNKFVILTLYVDDILIAGKDISYVNQIKNWLSSNFEMKDMGEAAYILGVKISRDRSRKLLSLSQESYINKVLERFKMQDCKPIDTPIAKCDVFTKDLCPKTSEEKKYMERVPYANAVGSLMYAMLCTRPDICFAVGMVSRYQSNPGEAHWKAVKRILRYLKGTADYSLCYRGNDLALRGYTDADWAGDGDERKSTSGFVFLLGNGAISWSSKKQTCIALSTMEAEFVALSAAAQEAVWLKRFMNHLNITTSNEPVTVFSDSQSSIAYTKDPKFHNRTKHIDIKYHFVKDLVAHGEIDLEYIATSEMVADPLTKAVARNVFEKHVRVQGLCKL